MDFHLNYVQIFFQQMKIRNVQFFLKYFFSFFYVAQKKNENFKLNRFSESHTLDVQSLFMMFVESFFSLSMHFFSIISEKWFFIWNFHSSIDGVIGFWISDFIKFSSLHVKDLSAQNDGRVFQTFLHITVM